MWVQVGTFRTPLSDGWGITTQGKLMVLSDGSSQLTWVDPAQNFKTVRRVTVTDRSRNIGYLNEVRAVGAGGRGVEVGEVPQRTDQLNSWLRVVQ